ncbi:MAG: SDR family oxidoreductase [Pseudomonadota bacterium]
MKKIVITGSTKGIGYGLAKAFLKKGCSVVISARGTSTLDEVLKEFEAAFGKDKVTGAACNVADYGQVRALWNLGNKKFGKIDIWINNAGICNESGPAWSVDPEAMKTIVDTNIVGALYGVRVAMEEMMKQGDGDIYNMYGFGAWDELTPPGLTVYGTTKRALRYLTEALILEAESLPVRIGWMMPGIVITDFVFKLLRSVPAGPAREQLKKRISVIADTVETVTPWLVDEVLKHVEKKHHGAEINYMPQEKHESRKIDPCYLNRDLFTGIEI